MFKSVNFPNKVAGILRIDPDGKDTTQFGVYSTNTVKEHELGTRYRLDDRVWHYGKASNALKPGFGVFDEGAWFAENTVAAAVVGQMFVLITTDATSGGITEGFGVENNMVGGYMVQPDGTHGQFRRIVGHVAAPTGTTVKVYLDGPITRDMVTNAYTEWLPNPYGQLLSTGAIAGGMNKGCMGVPSVVVAAGSYGWFQSWGPCWVTPEAGGDLNAGNGNTAHWSDSGNIQDQDEHTGAQLAGFGMGARVLANWANPPFLFLQICP